MDDNTREVNIAVLGASGVGKSTFMQCALDLKKTSNSPVSSKKVSLEGSISVVRLLELNMADVGEEDDSLQWPETIGDHSLPPIDGVLLLFDVMSRKTFDALPIILGPSFSLPKLTSLVSVPVFGVKHFDSSPRFAF